MCGVGDAGCREIVSSGILKRLKVLDLRNGFITDAGAQALAACPHLPHLQRLDLEGNFLTPAGVAHCVPQGSRCGRTGRGNSRTSGKPVSSRAPPSKAARFER
jgi:hypothetical protein